MDTKTLINMALAYKGMTQADLASKLNMLPQALHQRIKSGKFTFEEWDMIAKALGAEKAEMHLYFPDGKII